MPNLDADFFYEHAGWSYDPLAETPEEGRRRNSETLARAWALVSPEAEFRWHADGRAHLGDSNPPDACEGMHVAILTLREAVGTLPEGMFLTEWGH